MSSKTPNIKLFKWDVEADGEEDFDIEKSLNDNWDKIDTHSIKTDNDISELQKEDTANKQNIADIKAEQIVQNENISNLQTDNTTNKQDIANIKAEQITQNENISNLLADNATNKTEITNIKTEQEIQKTNIGNLQTDNESNKTDIQSLKILLETLGDTSGADISISLEVLSKLAELSKNQIIISDTNPEKECIWFEEKSNKEVSSTNDVMLETTAYDETQKFHAETDKVLETVTNMTEDITANDEIIVEEV